MARIAIILGRLVIGGSTMDTLQAANYLQDANEIVVITGEKGKNELDASFLSSNLTKAKIISLPGFQNTFSILQDYRTYVQVKKLLTEFKPDVVHTHSAKAGLIGRIAAKHAAVPTIIHTYHGLVFTGYYNRILSRIIVFIERWLASISTLVIALSDNQKIQITEKYRVCPTEKVRVLPLGIEMEKYTGNPKKQRSRFREKYFLADDEVAIGLIGRIVPVKNHEFFLAVIKRIENTGVKARFFIVGDGPLRQQLQEKASSSGIPFVFFPETPRIARLTFTSWETEMEMVMAGLDMVVLTSHNEGTPVSLIEAQAAEKPVVTINTGGISDIVKHGETGYVVAPGHTDIFTNFVLKLIKDPGLRHKMGACGAVFVRSRFQKQVQVKALHQLYNNLLIDNS